MSPGFALLVLLSAALPARAADNPVLRPEHLLRAQTFWDNEDWDWYARNIPLLETPEREIDTTYYYRWELVTKHLTYGSPDSGYLFTEFIDRPVWSGAYGAISCPAGHQLYEVRWLNEPRYAHDYARYWFRTKGAELRRYSTWLANAVWSVHLVHPDHDFTTGLLPDLVANFVEWEKSRYAPEVGLFWQTGNDDGMEFNINSRQTRDELGGAPGYRPTLNSYLWADARAIAAIARLAGDEQLAARYDARAQAIKAALQERLWDPRRQFFLHMARQDEERDGFTVKAGSLTYQTGRYAGSPHGRELIGYVPWAFGLPDAGRGYESAWRFLMDRDYFFADFGPTVTERHDPSFMVTKRCCVWSGQSWPYATTQTLVAMANLLNQYEQEFVTKDDYVKLLRVYTRTHRKDGRPYIAEGADPDTGSWEGYDSPGHSEHYFHSGYADLIITGLAGLRPRADDTVEVNPLIPDDWSYFSLDRIPYRGRTLTIVWDRDGTRYGTGAGLRVLADGRTIAASTKLERLTAPLPPARAIPRQRQLVNYAVNNEGTYYPRVTASFAHETTPLECLQDGSIWYHRTPVNRWTSEGSTNAHDWLELDFGVPRPVEEVRLYFLDDRGASAVCPPARFDLDVWDGAAWTPVKNQTRVPAMPTGRRANVVEFPAIRAQRLRVKLTHRTDAASGLAELEAWGEGAPPIAPAPAPAGNLAVNTSGQGTPAASASFTSPYDQVAMANDGRVSFRPSPHNRWTAFNSPNATDSLAIDLGERKTVGRVVVHIYDDHGGVQAPERYTVQTWDGQSWNDVSDATPSPPQPAGGRANTVTFPPVQTHKVRVLFVHKGAARSGVSEIEVWER